MLRIRDLDPKRGLVYSCVDATTGRNIHISVSHLLDAIALDPPELIHSIVHEGLIRNQLAANAINWDRCTSLLSSPESLIRPIIVCRNRKSRSPEYMLVDGNHRLMVHYHLGLPFIRSYILEPQQWLKFQIRDYPDTDLETLRSIPPIPKSI